MPFSCKKIATALLLVPSLVAVLPAFAVEPLNFSPLVLSNARTFSLKSQANGHEYKIFVSAPIQEAPEGGFPVLYTSDGNAMFPQMIATANLLGMNNRAIFVGIGYPGEALYDARRSFDLTSKMTTDRARIGGRTFESGGNDLFLDFIEKDLKPIIEKEYRIDRSKQTLFGHSFGGLFVLHTMFTRPYTFQTYVAAAPSIRWNNQTLLDEKKAFLEKNAQGLNIKLLVTDNTEPNRRGVSNDGESREANSLLPLLPISSHFIEELKNVSNLVTEYKLLENETHMSMVPGSITSGLRFSLGDTQRLQRGR